MEQGTGGKRTFSCALFWGSWPPSVKTFCSQGVLSPTCKSQLLTEGGPESTALCPLPDWAPGPREGTKLCFYEQGPRVETEEARLQELFELSDS